jgi:hypothetical protein
MTTINTYRVYRVEENRVAERFHDSIDGISEDNAFFIEDDTSWRILPVTLDFVSVRYLYCPVDVVWGYTLDGSGRPVYNSGTSVQPKWDDNDMDEIIGRALKVLGVSIKEGALLNYGEQVIQKGE